MRTIYRLTAKAEDERADFVSEYGYDGNCSCHLSPPCSSCMHPGNPHNQAEDDTAWEPDSDQVAPGFKRLWSTPRRCSRGGLLDYPTPQQRYLRLQSLVRYRRRPDAYPAGQEQLKGELGYVDGFRFITSPALPDPDQLAARITQRMNESAAVHLATNRESLAAKLFAQIERSGTAFITMGMDLASGPDWNVVQEWRTEPKSPVDLVRIGRAEVKRVRRAAKLRQLAARGAIGKADIVQE